MFSYLLKHDGSFDKAAILRDAAQHARRLTMYRLPGFPPQSYRENFAYCLRWLWSEAKKARAELALPAAEIEAREHRASLLFAADMIDHTETSLRVRAAVEARF